jgi:hypothetical protein
MMPEKKVWNSQEHPIICDTHGTYLKPKKSLWVADNEILEGLINQKLVVVVGERAESIVISEPAQVAEETPSMKTRSSRSKKNTEETPEQEQEVEVQLPEASNTEVIEEAPTEAILPEDEQ